jgi:hypothetical protein
MENPVVSQVERDVIDTGAVTGEQHQIAGPE